MLLSSKGANPYSRLFYFYLKGKVEQMIVNLNFYRTIIIRPSSLIRPNSNRLGERIGVKILKGFNRVGLFRSYRPVSVSRVASKMRAEVRNVVACGLTVVENDSI